jgi:hypothetical protein
VIEQVEKVLSEAQMLSFPIPKLEYFLQGQVHILLRGPIRNSSKPCSRQDSQSELQRSSLGKVSDRQIEADLKTKLLQMAMEKWKKTKPW